MRRRRLLLLGAGAQAKYACETLRLQGDTWDVTVVGTDGSRELDWPAAYGAAYRSGTAIIEEAGSHVDTSALICVADPALKAELWLRAAAAGLRLISAIHPAATVAATAVMGEGAIVNAGAVIQPFARIGRCAMIHAGAIVEHDCVLGDFVNLAPGCRLAGWVTVEDGATIFTGATVIPRKRIGAGAMVGAGAVVVDDVPARASVVGVPARPFPHDPPAPWSGRSSVEATRPAPLTERQGDPD